ncbi:hypothetical protein TSUD_264860 [Trifolium subterraneum]|uniref:Uncharacterized protein n=1 Tax=Trifolium subterraneum TaxID=3900 RepID=A0A2Z6M906_TRISU|nr:hypothetical protein TSUD_264860 [Trifolium subterraneum]
MVGVNNNNAENVAENQDSLAIEEEDPRFLPRRDWITRPRGQGPHDHVTTTRTNQSVRGGTKDRIDIPIGVNTRLLLVIRPGGTVTLLLVDIITIHHEVT